MSGVFLIKANKAWRENGMLKNEIISNFPFNETKPLVVVNMPDNHLGAHLFRNGLAAVIDLENGTPYKENQAIEFISLVNTITLQDSMSVVKTDSSFQVALIPWGRWIHGMHYDTMNYEVKNEWEVQGFEICSIKHKKILLLFGRRKMEKTLLISF
ncbi:MAG: hypothetical protein LRY27_01675 [Chitinophagales bacterium]|nr:hypothetical protein [Chitinophagales bacterium]